MKQPTIIKPSCFIVLATLVLTLVLAASFFAQDRPSFDSADADKAVGRTVTAETKEVNKESASVSYPVSEHGSNNIES